MNKAVVTHSGAGPEQEEGPGERKGNDRPDIVTGPGQPDDAEQEQGTAEIRPTPAEPELAPVPDHLKN